MRSSFPFFCQSKIYNEVETMELVPFKAVMPNEGGWVDARKLHAYLGVKTRFNDWARRNLLNTRSIKGSDYYSVQSIEQRDNPLLGANGVRTDYFISLSMAEHFAMLSHTDKAHQLRTAYIECRKTMQAAKEEFERLQKAYEALLKKRQPKRIKGTSYILTYEEHTTRVKDIFGNVEETTRFLPVRVKVSEAEEEQKRDYRTKHRTKVMAGLLKNQQEDLGKSVVIPMDRTKIHK